MAHRHRRVPIWSQRGQDHLGQRIPIQSGSFKLPHGQPTIAKDMSYFTKDVIPASYQISAMNTSQKILENIFWGHLSYSGELEYEPTSISVQKLVR